ncbi:hypothetical protein BH24ACT26_BH24ACT26_11150 [soil metagenome]
MQQEVALSEGTSRRGFLTDSAKVAGGGALALALGGTALMDTAEAQVTDVKVLNFALTLERLEYAFYRDGLKKFSERDFKGSSTIRNGGFGPRITNTVYDYFELIREHERIHVETLVSVVKSFGAKPVPECKYNFGYGNDINAFIDVAQALENTGVKAYDGALKLFDRPSLRTAGATIATVEARHASYLNLINGDVPFPDAFDEALMRRKVLEIAGQFIVSCP